MPRLKDDLTIKMDDDNMLARSAEPHAIHNDNTNVNLPFYYKFISIVFFFIFALKSYYCRDTKSIPLKNIINRFRNPSRYTDNEH